MQLRVLPNSSLAERSAELGDGQEESVAEDADLSSITEWELDFCSRPILDNRGKKVWELVVCDSKRQLRFSRYYPNNVINSGTLRDALVYIIQTLGVPKPQKVRFFRFVDVLSHSLHTVLSQIHDLSTLRSSFKLISNLFGLVRCFVNRVWEGNLRLLMVLNLSP